MLANRLSRSFKRGAVPKSATGRIVKHFFVEGSKVDGRGRLLLYECDKLKVNRLIMIGLFGLTGFYTYKVWIDGSDDAYLDYQGNKLAGFACILALALHAFKMRKTVGRPYGSSSRSHSTCATSPSSLSTSSGSASRLSPRKCLPRASSAWLPSSRSP